jgi:hypothetical protein
MAIAAFKPKVWAAELLVELEKSLVYAGPGSVNRNYEGEISDFGDTVHITTLADPTIGTYTAHNDITIEDVDDAAQQLLINQSKYFAFEVDDIEKRQARNGGAVLTEQARKAAYKLRDVADRYVASLMATGANFSDTLAVTSPANAYDAIVDLGTALDEVDVPSEGRFVVVPPNFHGLIKKDDRFIATGDPQAAAARINGVVGEAGGFIVKVSNNAPAGATTGRFVIAGTPIATTYAEQIAKTEGFRLEKRFADGVKGLHLYGSKVIVPDALAALDVTI